MNMLFPRRSSKRCTSSPKKHIDKTEDELHAELVEFGSVTETLKSCVD